MSQTELERKARFKPSMSATTNKIKVLYIGSWGRSGTTILSNILGELDGFLSAGEIYQIWQRGLIEKKLCGCSQPIPSCEFWGAVLKQNADAIDAIGAERLVEMSNAVSNPQVLLSLIPGGKATLQKKLEAYIPYVERLYQSIQTVSGCRVIVDASGTPLQAHILSLLPDIELYVVHVVRDPRAVAFSLSRKKAYDTSGRSELMERRGALFTGLGWSVWNTELKWLWAARSRYLLVRYETFISAPEATIRAIVDLCEENVTRWPFLADHEIYLHPNHHLSGNPSRFKTGRVKLALDDEWKTRMSPISRAIITGLFAPFILHYGYRL
jgi:hypothetical protein